MHRCFAAVAVGGSLFLLVTSALAPASAAAPSRPPDTAATRSPTLAVARALLQAERWDQAATAFARYLETNPLHGGAWRQYAYALTQLGRTSDAVAAYSHAYDCGDMPSVCAYNSACCLALAGQRDSALEWLSKAFRSGFTDFALIATDHDLDSIRSDPRFAQLLGPQVPPEISREDGWRLDLAEYIRQLESRHVNPYRAVSRDSLAAAVQRLRDRVGVLSDAEVVVGLLEIVAKVGDGHTSMLVPGRTPEHLDFKVSPRIAPFHHFPIGLEQFADGWFVVEASPDAAACVGKRVVAIDGTPIERALEAVKPLCPRDNDLTVLDRARDFLACPEVLQARGVTKSLGEMTWTLAGENGKTEGVLLRPAVWGETQPRSRTTPWVTMHDGASAETALWLRHPERPFWTEYLSDSRTLYLCISQIRDGEDETMEQLAQRIRAFPSRQPVDRLVIDLRRNYGGNNQLNSPLVHALIASPELNQRGKLFVITSRKTFSAAMCLAADLEQNTEAIFVGEPTGSRPNFVGETSLSTLPWSGLAVSISTRYWQNSKPWDLRSWIPPEIPAPMTSADFRANRDPALEAILEYREPAGS